VTDDNPDRDDTGVARVRSSLRPGGVAIRTNPRCTAALSETKTTATIGRFVRSDASVAR
jgi:hypothetical protein